MKKKLMIIISVLAFSLFASNVEASSVSISTSKSSVVVGNTVTITTRISSNSTILQAYGTIKCNSGLLLVSGNGEAINYYNGNDANTKTLTYSNTYKATKTGTISCSVSSVSVGTAASANFEDLATRSVSISVLNASSSSSSSGSSSSNRGGTTADKKQYSSDNNLSSLSIKGYELNPKFDKDTTEYKLELDSSVETIDIEAKASDDEATISGIGNKKVSEGVNTFEIKVTAENGNEKIYKIIVNVQDTNPIIVKIGKKKYTVIKKNNDLIDKLEGYEESTITINDQDVVAYTNNTIGYTLVLLKDSKGNINYYIYDLKNDSYTLYQEYKFGNLRLNILEMDKEILPDKYFKSKFIYNDNKIIAYKVKDNSKFYLFYAMNINTGKKNLYTYDSAEDTVQRYNQDEVNLYKNLNNDYSLFILIGLGSLGVIIVIVAITMIIKTKKRKKKYNYSPI